MKMMCALLSVLLIISTSSCSATTRKEPTGVNENLIEYKGQTYPALPSGDGVVRLLSHWDLASMADDNDALGNIYNLKIEPIFENYGSFSQKVELMQKSGVRLDAVLFSNEQYPISIAKGLYLPLDDYINFSDELWLSAKKASDKLRYNGKIYTVVNYDVRRFIWYNKKLFTDKGLTLPMDLLEKGQWTWENLQKSAEAITEDTDKDGIYETVGIMGSIGIFGGLFASKNTNFKTLTPDGIRNTCLDKDVADIMDYAYKLFGQQGFKYDDTQGAEMFINNRCGMLCEGYYIVFDPRYKELSMNGELEFVPFPRWENQKEPIYFTEFGGYLIPKNVENMDGSIAFLTYYQVKHNNSVLLLDAYNHMAEINIPEKSRDLFYKINTSDIEIPIPNCVLIDVSSDEWKPFTWLLDEQHDWKFIKLRTYYLYNQHIEQFNLKYGLDK